VLEISPPVPMDGDVATAFGRCAAHVSAAIERSPAHWAYWTSTTDLHTLELSAPDPPPSPAGPLSWPDEVLLSHGAADRVPTPG
jgi:hypothetical protein